MERDIGPGVNEVLESTDLSEDEIKKIYEFQQKILPPQKKDCPECHGYGSVKAPYYGRKGLTWRTFYQVRDCDVCMGTGKYINWKDDGGSLVLRAGNASGSSTGGSARFTVGKRRE